MPPLPELLDVDQLAAELGQTRRWVYRMHADHSLPAFKVGRALWFSRPQVLAWLEAHTSGATLVVSSLEARRHVA